LRAPDEQLAGFPEHIGFGSSSAQGSQRARPQAGEQTDDGHGEELRVHAEQRAQKFGHPGWRQRIWRLGGVGVVLSAVEYGNGVGKAKNKAKPALGVAEDDAQDGSPAIGGCRAVELRREQLGRHLGVPFLQVSWAEFLEEILAEPAHQEALVGISCTVDEVDEDVAPLALRDDGQQLAALDLVLE
jgi:hypothetical protein